jgi:hypothetical protein
MSHIYLITRRLIVRNGWLLSYCSPLRDSFHLHCASSEGDETEEGRLRSFDAIYLGTLVRRHDVTPQKIVSLIVTAVRISDPGVVVCISSAFGGEKFEMLNVLHRFDKTYRVHPKG